MSVITMNGHWVGCWDMECDGKCLKQGAEFQKLSKNKKKLKLISGNLYKQPTKQVIMSVITTTTYKCRAECEADVKKMIKKMGLVEEGDIVIDKMFYDCEWTFNDTRTREAIIELMRECDDCHVAYQTIQPVELYTGDRNYDL